ncbi:MAG: hypothetical protein KGH99_03630 [Thaumarchaeota archaeon]|nr:hypothetical protein [Nitrososphaerota archaeon]
MRENRELGNNREMGGQGLVQTEIPSHIRQERVSFQNPSHAVVSSSNEVSNGDTENYVSGIVGVRTHTIGGISNAGYIRTKMSKW